MMTDTASAFTPVDDVEGLDPLFERSNDEPVVLFKHDPYCSISVLAFHEMARLGHDATLIDVAHEKAVSSEVTQRTGVRHESPQVIILRHGRVAWSGSHFDITTRAVSQALDTAA